MDIPFRSWVSKLIYRRLLDYSNAPIYAVLCLLGIHVKMGLLLIQFLVSCITDSRSVA